MRDFVKVEGGEFVRTRDFQVKKGLEISEITVRVRDFYIADFVVTQGDWERVMGCKPSHFKGKDLPVELVGWYDAVVFCNA